MLNPIEGQYHEIIKSILYDGTQANDRTQVGTFKSFGHTIRLDVSQHDFPILKTKAVNFHAIVVELLWLMSGQTNIKYLNDHGVHIWNEWADEHGNLGPVYGAQWRGWGCGNGMEVDQLSKLINTIVYTPDDRRQLVSAWNVGELEDMLLPPCHYCFQTFVDTETEELSLMINQRSCDMFLGVPFNLTSYALLLVILANLTDKKPKQLIWVGGDCHVYANHLAQVHQQMHRHQRYYMRMPLTEDKYTKPVKLRFAGSIDFSTLDSFLATTMEQPDYIYLEDYHHMGAIKAPVAV